MLDYDAAANLGRLILRLALASLFWAHAWLKAFVFGLSGTSGFFASLGLPRAMGPAMIALEAIGGLLLLLGVRTRIAALVMVPGLIGAIVLVHGKAGFFFDAANGGWEYPAYWAVTLVVLALIGPGRWSFDAVQDRTG